MSILPSSPKFAAGEPYVFISYAREDQAVAEQVEVLLKAAGLRVFFAPRSISPGANWDQAIEVALRECQRLVLLLSAASMPYRKEVHREWFYFDQEQKPIYPLFIADCERHSRLFAYNYIDARSDLHGALQRLVNELRQTFQLPEPLTAADRISIFADVETETRTLPEALQALYDAVRNAQGSAVLSAAQAIAIRDHKPADLKEYRLGRLAEWSLPQFQINRRFVNLTLLLDRGEDEPQRWQRAEDLRFDDLGRVLEKAADDPALVLLGAPGSGKSTLLRRLQLDHSIERLCDEAPSISFFVPLNSYRAHANGDLPEPGEWLQARWALLYPQLAPLATYLGDGRALLLLDALNEMPHRDDKEYRRLVGLWRDFVQDAARAGNRLVFSCRRLDYSALLSSKDLPVPQVEVQPMTEAQVQGFLEAYAPGHRQRIWDQLTGTPQFSLFQTPYFLRLLCGQVETMGGVVPRGRAGLFTGFVRHALNRELHSELFQAETLLSEDDRRQLSLRRWRDAFDLPDDGWLIRKLSDLAFHMQESGLQTEARQVSIDVREARDLIEHEGAREIIKAGVALSILDEDVAAKTVSFFHESLQEYFAARRLAREPNPLLVQREWQTAKASPSLAEALAGLAGGDPLPPLPQTGWEETTVTAAPMAKDPQAFIRALLPHNLPLAARCAAAVDVHISDDLKREIQQSLIGRTQDQRADLRARIAAGEALGLLGDPRFEMRTGPHGAYLRPPLIEIPGGRYRLGNDNGSYPDEKPVHSVELSPFQIGQFPITNAEYRLFIEAGGYADERWWDTAESLAWLRGKASTEGNKQQWRENRKAFQRMSEEYLRGLVAENRITSEDAEQWIEIRNWTDEYFEQQLEEWWPEGKVYRQPEFWEDARFNNPAQPVVGVTWFEARAYCRWLMANAQAGPDLVASERKVFRLPTEAEFEAAAAGKAGRRFPYGEAFDVSRSNTFESHIRRTTPVGVFANATPEGAFDLSGNAFTWTLSIYNQEKFPYPYQSGDGREDIERADVRRVLRGGSWFDHLVDARTVYRYYILPAFRINYLGFRVVFSRSPSS